MLRSIKLSVDKVYIDPTSTLVHTGTSYQVSNTPDFTVVANLVLNVVNNATSLLSHTFDHNMILNQPLYVRTRYHLNNGDISSWSNIIELSSNQVGLKSSSTVVATPIISVKYDYTNSITGEIVISLSAVSMYSGVGTINATSWTLETTDGKILYELPRSADVLNELRLPITVLGTTVCFVATAIVHTNTNTSSNRARVLTTIKKVGTKYFTLTLKNTLYTAGSNYILITDHASKYTSSEVRVLAPDNSVVEAYTGLDAYVATFNVTTLDINGYYSVEVRAIASSGQTTPWIEAYRGGVSRYDVRQYSPTVSYTMASMGFGGYLNFNGLSTQTTQADEDDVFYLAVPETTTLAAHRVRGGSIYPINKTIDLGINSLFKIPTINYLSLYNGNYLLDHSLDGATIEVAKFTQLQYNHITKTLTPGVSLVRPDERYGTGRSGSAVVTRDGLVYYVPGAMMDATNKPIDLELRVYDINTNTITDHIPLPVTGLRENVTLSEDANGVIYLYGGTTSPTANAQHGEVSATIVNRGIYKYDKLLKTWTLMLTLPLANAMSYRYKAQSLRNGDIFIIDTTPTLVGGGTRTSYVYKPSTNGVTRITNNPTQEHLGITIETKSGDIALMTSTSDLVEAFSFLKTTTSTNLTTAGSITASQPVTDLVVAVGDVVYIRDPYRYNSIVIQGNSLANTGRLVWIKDNISHDYFYNDLIVTRNMVIPADTLANPQPTYNKVVVVGDATLTVL